MSDEKQEEEPCRTLKWLEMIAETFPTAKFLEDDEGNVYVSLYNAHEEVWEEPELVPELSLDTEKNIGGEDE